MSRKTIYHGSEIIIEKPELAAGKMANDFGRGFYCTEDRELAGEWACKKDSDGFINVYELDCDELNVLDLNGGEYNVLNWIAILLQYRTFRIDAPIAQDAKEYLLANYSVDIEPYDIVVGYRADDSYFSYAMAWLSNRISIHQLSQALVLGQLGEQIVLRSDKAINALTYVGSERVSKSDYYPRFFARDSKAREDYHKITGKFDTSKNALYMLDILREEVGPDDPRIQQHISRRR